MEGFTSIEAERLRRINFLMDRLYDQVSAIYEELVDRETKDCRKNINLLMNDLKDLDESLRDEF
jgi:primosomal protein N''